MSRVIRWRSLELEGFGVYDRPVRFEFPEEFGVLCLPNENGKSTLVTGLRAALFGLRERDPRGGPSIERYRSWGDAAACRVVLEFASEERRLRLSRELASHHVRLARIDDAGRTVEEIYDGVHNPGARGAARMPWEEHLQRLLGEAGHEETFAASVLLEQPLLPAPEIRDSVRKLVGGVGRIGGQEAKDRLFETVKKLTAATGDRDLVPPGGTVARNQQKPGRVEQTEDEIRVLEARMRAAIESFEEQRVIEESSVSARIALETARREDEEAQRRLDLLDGHRKLRRKRDDARDAVKDLEAALTVHDEAAAKARVADERLAAEFADVRGAGEDVKALVREARVLEAAIENLRTAFDRQTTQHETRQEALRVASEERARYADLEDRPEDFPGLVAQLARTSAEVEQVRERIRAIEAERSSIEGTADGGSWIRALGPDRSAAEAAAWLASARAEAGRWTDAVRSFGEADARLADLLGERARLDAVADLPADVADAVADSDRVREERHRAEQMAAALQAQRHHIAQRRAELETQLRLADGIPKESFLAALKARAEARRRIEDLTGAAEAAEAKLARAGRLSWIIGAASGIVLAAATSLGLLAMQATPAASLGIGLVLGAGVGVVLAIPLGPRGFARRRWERLRAERYALSSRLAGEHIPSGPWMPDDEGIYERARTLITQGEEELQRLAAQEQALESGSTEGLAVDADSPLDALAETMESLSRQTGYPAAEAVRRYRELGVSIEHALRHREERLRATEVAADAVATDPLATAPPPPAVASNCAILAIPASTARACFDALAGLDTAYWEAREREAREHIQRVRRIEDSDRDRSRLEVDSLPDLERSLADLARSCAPFGADTDLAELRARWERRNDAIRREAEAASALRVADEGLRATREDLRAREEALEEITRRIGRDRIEGSGSSVDQLGARMEQSAELERIAVRERERAADALRTARGGPYESREALASALERFVAQRGDAASALLRMEEASEWLAAQDALSPEDRDRQYRDAEERRSACLHALNAAMERKSNAEAALAHWAPREEESIASLELAIEAKRGELSALRARADAATRAWHLLDESIREFQSSHRAILAERLDATFGRIAGRASRRIVLAEDLDLRVLESGREVTETSLSQGARDQLSFCLRLALADLMAGDLLLPLILDDPFVHSDGQRLDRIREVLAAASADRQIILLTQDERLRGWGESIRRARIESGALIG